MKVKVIGSGSMMNKYNSACYLIDDNIMFDFPNGACKYLFRYGIDPGNIEHIILSHFHGDHYFDLPFYILHKTKCDNKNANIYCYKKGKNKIKQLGILAFPNCFKDVLNEINLKYVNDDKFSIGNYKINKILVDHGRMKPAYGCIISYNDVKIGFTGDTSLCKSVCDMASICKYLFCDCMLINGTDKHQGIDNIKVLLEKYKNCIFVVSHLNNDTRKELLKEKIDNLIVPEDGLEIDI